MTIQKVDSRASAAVLQERAGPAPVDFALVLGMGIGGFAEHLVESVLVPYSDLAGFPTSASLRDESGIVIGRIGNSRLAVIDGRVRFTDRRNATSIFGVLETVKLLGASAVVVTGAVGSTRQDVKPGAIVTIRDHINFSGINPLRQCNLLDANVDLTRCYDATLCERFVVAAGEIGRKVPDVVQFYMPGPNFETPAEVAAARLLGGDVIGMSIVPEVIIGRYLGLRMMASAIVTNYAAGPGLEPITSDHVHRVAGATMASLSRILARFCEIWRLSNSAML